MEELKGEIRRSPEEISRIEAKVDDIIPVLAHGFSRRIEESGLRGKVTVGSAPGKDWAVGSTKGNLTGVPNLIVYPEEMLKNEDLQIINARLRHEIGNLNYPQEKQLENLRAWCVENKISPVLVTSLAQTIHSPSVDYMEMRNSHSQAPEENFRVLYKNSAGIALNISEQAPYKQALDLVYLQGLKSIGLCDPEILQMARKNALPAVNEVVSDQLLKQVEIAVKNPSPSKQELIVKQVLWPGLSRLVAAEAIPGQIPQDISKSETSPDDESGIQPGEEKQQSAEEQVGESEENPVMDNEESQGGNEGEEEKSESEPQSDNGGKGGESEGESESGQGSSSGSPKGAGASPGEGGQGESGNGSESKKLDIQEEIEKIKDEIAWLEQQLNEGVDKQQNVGGLEKDENDNLIAGEDAKSGQGDQSSSTDDGGGSPPKSGQDGAGSVGKPSDEVTLDNDKPLHPAGETELGESKPQQSELQKKLDELILKLNSLENKLNLMEEGGEGAQMPSTLSMSPGGASEGANTDGVGIGTGKQQGNNGEFQQGGSSNKRELSELFSSPDEKLLKQLQEMSNNIGSKFIEKTEDGEYKLREVKEEDQQVFESKKETVKLKSEFATMTTLNKIKQEHKQKLELVYKEMSGLEGQALSTYAEYMEEMSGFIDDVTDFFVERFKLDEDYKNVRNQLQGASLQRGFQRSIMGSKSGSALLRPEIFERRIIPEKPTIIWTIIIDNSGSCSGETIEYEKKLAVALVEIAKKLKFPLEIVTFGGEQEYTFLKTHDQEAYGHDLEKLVLLQADQGTPDVVTLDASCKTTREYSQKFKQPYNFVYFMTDGQSGGGSIQDVTQRYKRDMVITGIGLADAATTIKETWGKNGLSVPDVNKLAEQFLRKVEDQIGEIFD